MWEISRRLTFDIRKKENNLNRNFHLMNRSLYSSASAAANEGISDVYAIRAAVEPRRMELKLKWTRKASSFEKTCLTETNVCEKKLNKNEVTPTKKTHRCHSSMAIIPFSLTQKNALFIPPSHKKSATGHKLYSQKIFFPVKLEQVWEHWHDNIGHSVDFNHLFNWKLEHECTVRPEDALVQLCVAETGTDHIWLAFSTLLAASLSFPNKSWTRKKTDYV